MAKKISSGSFLVVILALFIIFFVLYNVTANRNVAIINKTTTLTPKVTPTVKEFNPIFITPGGIPSANRRAYVDAHTYTPRVDITPYNPFF